MKHALPAVLALLLSVTTAFADVPQAINYQGRLLDADGDPVDEPTLVNFVIWRDAASTSPGDKVWESGFHTIQVSDGLLSVLLGAPPMPPLPDDIFRNDTNLYLGITIESDNEISPRTKLVSAGSAYHSLRADTAGLASSVADNSVTGSGIADGSIGAADIDNSSVQQRVAASCPPGQSIRAINPDGSVVCEPDDGADYTAGDGLQLIGSEFSLAAESVTGDHIAADAVTAAEIASNAVGSDEIQDSTVGSVDIDNTQVQTRVAGDCPPGSSIRRINADGTVVCESDDGTAYTPGSGLQLIGSVLSVAPGGITSNHIAADAVGASELAPNSVHSGEIATSAVGSSEIMDFAIEDEDISPGANIAASKIGGTAMNLSSTQTATGAKTFAGEFHCTGDFEIGDSLLRSSGSGLQIRNGGSTLLDIEKTFDMTTQAYGTDLRLYSSNIGSLVGQRIYVGNTGGGSGSRYGTQVYAYNSLSSSEPVYGVWASSGHSSKYAGTSYGVAGRAFAGIGSTAYGIYGYSGGAGTDYAGYFSGDVRVTGTLSKGGGAFKIDHPLDPANKYLQHSFVESPDMMNVYNGNVTLDDHGEATVILPDYFEALNRDFRYQLTAIGAPGPNLYIADKIQSNRFRIAGGQPGMEVSWQVTGVRHDRWAEANRIEVELDKPQSERGRYLHYKAYGVGIEQAVEREQLQEALAADTTSAPPDSQGDR